MLALLFAFSVMPSTELESSRPVLIATNTVKGTPQEQQEVEAFRAEANRWAWFPKDKDAYYDKKKRDEAIKKLRKYEKEFQEYENYLKNQKGPIPEPEGVYDEPWQFPRHSHGL